MNMKDIQIPLWFSVIMVTLGIGLVTVSYVLSTSLWTLLAMLGGAIAMRYWIFIEEDIG